MENKRTGIIAFISEPAPSTSSLIPLLLLARLRGTLGSSSPAILVNPPRGMAFSEYSVSPRFTDSNLGGKPRPNSSTFIPKALAVEKCPSSWARIITARTARKATMYSGGDMDGK